MLKQVVERLRARPMNEEREEGEGHKEDNGNKEHTDMNANERGCNNLENKRKFTADQGDPRGMRDPEIPVMRAGEVQTASSHNAQGNKSKEREGSQSETKRGERHKGPRKLTQSEWESELEERKKRKNNIKIYGMKIKSRLTGKDIEEKIREQTGVTPWMKRRTTTRKGILVELGSVYNKIRIMKANHINARGGGQVEISDDWTEREMVVQNWLEEYAKELRRQERSARTGHLKMWSKENWKTWDDRQGRLVEPDNDRDTQKMTKDQVPRGKSRFRGFRNRSWNNGARRGGGGDEGSVMEHSGGEEN